MEQSSGPNQAHPGLSELGRLFLREGNMTFGGGVPTVAALQRELVTNRGWMDQAQYSLCYVLSRVTPGTNLLAFCTAAGWLLRGWRGAVVALLAGSIPSSLQVALLTGGFDAWSSRPLVQTGIDAVLASSVGILLASFWLLVKPHLKRGHRLESGAVVAGSILLSMYAGMTPVAVLALAGVAGLFMKDGAGKKP